MDSNKMFKGSSTPLSVTSTIRPVPSGIGLKEYLHQGGEGMLTSFRQSMGDFVRINTNFMGNLPEGVREGMRPTMDGLGNIAKIDPRETALRQIADVELHNIR